MMKMEASTNFVKQVWSVVRGVVKTKSTALKDRATDVMKSKLVALGLVKNKKIFKAICHKMNVLFHAEKEENNDNMALAVCAPSAAEAKYEPAELDYLSHTLFESPRNSISSMLDGRLSTCTDLVELEDEIDDLADIFIKRFHAQMRFQKQSSFKRYQEMLNRGV
ncbi:hypothetical protein SUGI_0970620 [Cryptomeria japonica]|uniref:uncharacterized protein LOC131054861 n=1 Tax=Cryptomeria japonica TaxID=3369 RepID=UPI0024149B6E|nr:uncharacterized protein LOC131054861 [Cryptomeria japonica]GLJ46074.1 hypothetical protein SUGI_0970620 [Cryptomeria japonica]